MPKLLVTTALEGTSLEGREMVLLGEWCKLYAKRDQWASRRHEVLPYHRDVPGKRHSDYQYLLELYARVLPLLARGLNACHEVDHPLRYWEIITGLWLQSYISALYDRWECIRTAFEHHSAFDTVSLSPGPDLAPPTDYSDALRQLTTDEWNYRVFLEILRIEYADRTTLIEARGVAPVREPAVLRAPPMDRLRIPRSALRMVIRAATGIADATGSGSDIVLINSYFSTSALIRLSLLLRQVPRLHPEFASGLALQTPAEGSDGPLRARLEKEIGGESGRFAGFEAFLLARLARDLPLAHLEGYGALRHRASQVNGQPKVIFTANAHWNSELFKVWAGQQVLRASRLIVSDHGGSLPPDQYVLDVEENIADVYVPTFRESHPKHKLLPPTKYVGSKPTRRKRAEFLTLISYDAWRYTVRPAAHPYGSQVLRCYEDSLRFHDRLPEALRKSFRIKTPPFERVWDRHWDLSARYRDRLGERTLLNEVSLKQAFRFSKVVVCTYPQSTFTEAMLSGIPTIMFFDPSLNGIHPVAGECVRALLDARILFFSPEEAADHSAAIWDDAEGWWNNSDVVAACRLFFESTMNCDRKPLRRWATFLKAQRNSVAAMSQ